MSIRFEKFKPTTKVSEMIDTYKRKIEAGILPPDPARIVEAILRIPPAIEHTTPLPPILETIHDEVTSKVVESLPRLPMTRAPPVFKWREWIRGEEW